ncbi:MAG: GMC oxidoreductase, partial [Terriglobia bacterium]
LLLRGGNLSGWCVGSLPMETFGLTPPSVKAHWGSAWKKAALQSYDHIGRISFSGEHLAYKDNYMDLDPTYKDQYGDPLIRLTLDWRDNERRMVEFMTAKAIEIARAMNAREIVPFPGLKHYDGRRYQSTHISGGTMMGASSNRSVVNPFLQHWEIPNLFVMGASIYPQNSAAHPTITILALTLRSADTIVDRYLKHPGALA